MIQLLISIPSPPFAFAIFKDDILDSGIKRLSYQINEHDEFGQCTSSNYTRDK